MNKNEARAHIDDAHRGYESWQRGVRGRQPDSTADGGVPAELVVAEVLHHLIHAVDTIEKRLSRLDGPMFPKLNAKVSPLVERNRERISHVFRRAQTAVGGKLPHLKRKQSALEGETLLIGHEVTELRDEVRSLREAMEALARKA